jgi:hypothetical protein
MELIFDLFEATFEGLCKLFAGEALSGYGTWV